MQEGRRRIIVRCDSEEAQIKLCRKYAGWDAGSELKRGGGGWQERGKKYSVDRPVTSPALALRMLIYWAGCGNDKR